MRADTDVDITPLSSRHMADAARLCARSMRDNPIHERVFGCNTAQRQQRLVGFFGTLMVVVARRGVLTGAYVDDTLIGVLGMLPPRICRSIRPELLGRLWPLLRGNTAPGMLRQCRWLGAWAWNDPREPHWHLGPLAVDSAWQGRGVGSRLTRQAIDCLDGQHIPAYLETDKPTNVRFYEKFGFRVIRVLSLLGTPSWLLWRAPSELKSSPTRTLNR